MVREMISTKQLEENLIFTGPLRYDVYNFSPFDIFFLSSREDTYPLVVLEAAIMKIPTICFADSGGIVEFIGDDAGWSIGDFSIGLAANKIIELQSKKELVCSFGDTAFDKVVSLHCDSHKIVNQYEAIVGDLLR